MQIEISPFVNEYMDIALLCNMVEIHGSLRRVA